MTAGLFGPFFWNAYATLLLDFSLHRDPRRYLTVAKMTRQALIGILLLLMTVAPLQADTAAVAGSIHPCMAELASLYSATGKTPPDLVMGSSGKLAAQIKAGAPFGLYLSASRKWALHLQELGLLEEIHPMATSPIVLWWTKDEAPTRELLKDETVRVALPDPEAAPFGKAGKEYLVSQGLFDTLLREQRLIIVGTVQQAALAVRNGGADLAIISLSIARKMDGGSEAALPIPPLANAGALVKGKGTPELRDFWAFIRSEKAAPIWTSWGFEPVTD